MFHCTSTNATLDPSFSRSNRLHIDIFRGFFFINSRPIQGIYYLKSSKMMSKYPEVLNFQPVASYSWKLPYMELTLKNLWLS